MTDFPLKINEEKTIKSLKAALKYYELDREYSIEKIKKRIEKMSRHGYGDLVWEITSKAKTTSIDEMNKFLELLSAYGNILPNPELGGLSPAQMVEWHRYQKIKNIENEEFSKTKILTDTLNFLEYIKNNKIILTQTLRELKRKDIYSLNAILVEPDEIDHKIGDKIYKLNCEDQAHTVHFLKFLTDVAGLTKQRLNKITITKKGEKFLSLLPAIQFEVLFDTWLNKLSWACLQYFDDDFINALQDERHTILYRLVIFLDLKKKVSVHDFNQQLIALTEIKTDETDGFSLKYTTERTILNRLEYFGLLQSKKKLGKDKLSILLKSENNEYYLIEFGKKYLTNYLLKDAADFEK